MKLYHGSNRRGIRILEPRQADHDRPYIYLTTMEVVAEETQVIPFPNIPCARLGTAPLEISGYREVGDAYELFQNLIRQGKLCVGKYEEKPEKELRNWYRMILQILKEKDMKENPECSYAKFVREKFPWVWEEYLSGQRMETMQGVKER